MRKFLPILVALVAVAAIGCGSGDPASNDKPVGDTTPSGGGAKGGATDAGTGAPSSAPEPAAAPTPAPGPQ